MPINESCNFKLPSAGVLIPVYHFETKVTCVVVELVPKVGQTHGCSQMSYIVWRPLDGKLSQGRQILMKSLFHLHSIIYN